MPFGKLFNTKSTKTETRTKNPIIASESYKYKNGQGKPVGQNIYETWITQIKVLRTAIGTTAELASGANIKFYKEDSKGKKKLVLNPKQFDRFFMNDKDDLTSWLYNYFGQIKTYDNVFIIPEASKYKPRAGKVDFFIIDNLRCQVNPNETGSQTIKSITYKSSQGLETEYPYEDIIYISKPLTANNLLYGISRLSSLNSDISRILSMGDYIDKYISSGAKKSAIIGTDDLLSPRQEEELQETLNRFFNDPNQKTLMLNSEKLTVKEISEGLASSDVANFMIKLNTEVIESYNMPKFLKGNYEGVSNAVLVRESLRIFFEIALKPEFVRLQRHLTRYARDVLNLKNFIIEFDYEGISILEDSLEEKLNKAEKMNKMGAYSLNEVRLAVGEERIENDNFDLHLAPAYLLSGTPVTIENLYEDIARKLDNENTNSNNDVPSGTGGENNSENMNGSN